jgi:alanyl aminopeptidase
MSHLISEENPMRPSLRPISAWTSVCLAVLVAVSAAYADEPRLDPNVAPTFEAIELNLDSDKEDYTGTVRIELLVGQATREFMFHAEEMTLDQVELRGADGAIPVEIASGGDRGTRRVTCAKELTPGNYTLEIAFSKPYNTNAVGLYRVLHEGDGYLFTQMEAMDARKAFPCWDEPIFKIPFQMTLTVPLQQEAVSNAPVEKEIRGADTRTLVFKKLPPTSSYLIAIAVGPLESVPITGMDVPGRIWTPKGKRAMGKYAASITPGILKELEMYFGTPYPYEKCDLIAVPEFWPGAMENPGLVTFRDGLLLVDPKSSSAAQKRRLGYVTAHELAHMWFGDYVTMAWWDDLWLNESFADWLSEKVALKLYPDTGMDSYYARQVNETLQGDARSTTTPIRKEIKSGNEVMQDVGLAYEKGRSVLRMVEMFIGEDAFQRGVRSYLEANKWSNATGTDLFTQLSSAADRDLQPLLASYLDQPGFPLVRVDVSDGGVLTVSQKRFSNAGTGLTSQTWTVPVRLKISDGKNVQVKTVLLDKESRRVEVPGTVDWVMPDESGTGYYRWIVPLDMMLKLAADPMQTLSERERARFLSNAGALLVAGEISGDEYLRLTAAFAGTPEADVVSVVVDDLNGLQAAFVTDDLREPYANYVRRALTPAKERYGIAPRADDSDDVANMRPALIRMLGDDANDAEVRDYCREMAAAHLQDPDSVDPAIASSVLRVAAIDGDRTLYDRYRTAYETSKVPTVRNRYLGALGAFRDPDLQKETLAYVLTDNVRATDTWTVLSGLFATEGGRERVYQWLTENYDALAARVPGEFASYFPFMVSGCSEQRLQAAQKFFAMPEHQVDGTEASMNKVAERINDCVNLRSREGDAVATYLRNLPAAP